MKPLKTKGTNVPSKYAKYLNNHKNDKPRMTENCGVRYEENDPKNRGGNK